MHSYGLHCLTTISFAFYIHKDANEVTQEANKKNKKQKMQEANKIHKQAQTELLTEGARSHSKPECLPVV
jgi:predicted RNA-binding protein YlxR (DUF448 family)